MSEKIKIDRSVFRYIEHEMHNYDRYKEEIELQREVILHGTVKPEEGTGGVQTHRISDVTASKAMDLTTSVALAKMERSIKAVDRALRMLPYEHNLLFDLQYRQKKEWRDVAEGIPVSDSVYFKKRRELVYAVGLELGEVERLGE